MAVTKQWSQSTYQRGESAEDVYWVDAANENAAMFTSGVPAQNTSHLLDPRLLAQVPIVRPLVLGTLYEVRVRYVRLRGDSQPEDNPLDESPTLLWQIGSTTESVDADADGNPLINSVGDLFEGLTDEFPTLFLAYSRNEGTYDVQKAIAFGNKTNSDSFSIRAGNGFASVNPGQALCRSITAESFAVNAEYVRVTYNFEFREDGFDRRLIDQGLNGIYLDASNAKQVARFVDAQAEPLTTPVRLKNGKPIKRALGTEIFVGLGKATPQAGQKPEGAEVEGDEGVDFLIYKRKKQIAFAGLSL